MLTLEPSIGTYSKFWVVEVPKEEDNRTGHLCHQCKDRTSTVSTIHKNLTSDSEVLKTPKEVLGCRNM